MTSLSISRASASPPKHNKQEELTEENEDLLQQKPIKSKHESKHERKKALITACVERLARPKTFPSVAERYVETYRGRAKSSTEIRSITDRLYLNNTKFGKFPNNLADRCVVKTAKQIEDINERFYDDFKKLESFSARTIAKTKNDVDESSGEENPALTPHEQVKSLLTNEDVCRLYRKAIHPKERTFARPTPEQKRLLEGKFTLGSTYGWEGYRSQHPW